MIVTGLLSFVIITQVIRLTDLIFSLGMTIENILLPTTYVVLPLFYYVTPIAFFFAVLTTFTKLSNDHELVGLFSTGYSPLRAYLPTLGTATICFVISIIFAFYLESWGIRQYQEFAFTKAQSKIDTFIKTKLQPGTFTDELFNYVFYAEEISKDRIHFKNVILAPKNSSDQSSYTITAPRAEIHGEMSQNNLKLHLFHGNSFSADYNQNSTVVSFEKAKIDLIKFFQVSPTSFHVADDSFFILTPQKLTSAIEKLRLDDAPHKKQLYQAQYIYHNRISHPFIIIALAIIGMVLGSLNPRQSRNWPQLAAALILVSTHLLRFLSKMATDDLIINPILAAWIPTLFCFLIAWLLFYQGKDKAMWDSII